MRMTTPLTTASAPTLQMMKNGSWFRCVSGTSTVNWYVRMEPVGSARTPICFTRNWRIAEDPRERFVDFGAIKRRARHIDYKNL